jgi:hypothetical protein
VIAQQKEGKAGSRLAPDTRQFGELFDETVY